jgi:hypothetical protein
VKRRKALENVGGEEATSAKCETKSISAEENSWRINREINSL